MASSLCRSKTLTNLFVYQVVALDITELEPSVVNRNNQWAYVISVTWSDMRETKVSVTPAINRNSKQTIPSNFSGRIYLCII